MLIIPFWFFDKLSLRHFIGDASHGGQLVVVDPEILEDFAQIGNLRSECGNSGVGEFTHLNATISA